MPSQRSSRWPACESVQACRALSRTDVLSSAPDLMSSPQMPARLRRRSHTVYCRGLYLPPIRRTRTDQCPAPEAAVGECLVIDEQFRTHTYVKVDHKSENRFLENVSAVWLSAAAPALYAREVDRNPTDGSTRRTSTAAATRLTALAHSPAEERAVALQNGLKLQMRWRGWQP